MKEEKENELVHEKVSPVYERTIAYQNNLMVVVCDFSDGPMSHPEPPHSHPHEQITYVAEGELFFHKGENIHRLVKGDLIIVMPGVPHCIQTLSSYVRLIDSFYPVRKDFLK